MTGANAESVSPTGQGTETILVVEDEPAVRQLAALALRMQGYTVIESRTGAEAIRLAQSYPLPIRLLISDAVLVDMDGRTLADEVARARPGIPVIFVMGSLSDVFAPDETPGHRRTFLHKPYTPSRLAKKVRKVLDQEVRSCVTAEP